MPNTVSQSHFAKMCGVSRQAISKAKNEKPPAIKLYGKHVNLDHRITCEYFFTHTGKNLRPESVDDVPPVKAKVKPKPKPKPPRRTSANKKTPVEPITAPIDDEPLGDPDEEPDDGYALPLGIKSFEDITIHNIHRIPLDLVKKYKELEQTKKNKQDREQKRGDLIERKIVKQFLARIHTVDTNQWKTLDDKIAPEVCRIFNVKDGGKEAIQARKMITEEATKILRYTKRLIDEFLIDNEGAKG